jgi:hypothetical protein
VSAEAVTNEGFGALLEFGFVHAAGPPASAIVVKTGVYGPPRVSRWMGISVHSRMAWMTRTAGFELFNHTV